MALGLVLLVLILTSQSEWKRQPKNEMDLNVAVSRQHHISTKRELIKEQIILSQEKKIYILNELVKNLQQQLAQCHENNSENVTEVALDPQNEMAKIEEDV